MGKLPSWMKVVSQDKSEPVNQVIIVICINRWHPGWWLFYWESAYKSAREISSPLHVWFPVALHRFFFIGREYIGDGVEVKHE
jgi:hypothetical protein